MVLFFVGIVQTRNKKRGQAELLMAAVAEEATGVVPSACPRWKGTDRGGSFSTNGPAEAASGRVF